MRLAIPVFVILAFCLGAAQAEAKSCSAFAVIKSYDADSQGRRGGVREAAEDEEVLPEAPRALRRIQQQDSGVLSQQG